MLDTAQGAHNNYEMNSQTKLENLISIGLTACDAIDGEIQSGIRPYTKQDGSTVTNADHASEQVIVPQLRRLFPHTPVVSEEAHAAGESDAWEDHAWLVDPLDSTSGFARGSPDYAVIVGEVHAGKPIWGMVAVPHTRTIYVGDVQNGRAIKYVQGVITDIQCRPIVPSHAVLVHSPHEPAYYLDHMPMCTTWARGSALKFALVAEGAADYYVRRGSLSPWDIAGGHALVQAAGGRVTNHVGGSLVYQAAHTHMPPFVVSGSE